MSDTYSADEIKKMEEDLAVLDARLQAHYLQFGKDILQQADSEQRVVDQMVDEMIQLSHRLCKAKNEIQCPACMTWNNNASRYCSFCGKGLPEQAAT